MTKLYRTCCWFAWLTLLCSLVMNALLVAGPYSYPFQHNFSYDIDSPALAAELAQTPGDLEKVTQQADASNPDPNRTTTASRALEVNRAVDCVFIAFYTLYLITLASAFGASGTWRVSIGILALLTMVFDFWANWLIFCSLNARSLGQFLPSYGKWLLSGITLLAVGKLVASTANGPYSMPTRRLLGCALFVSSGLILYGTLAQQYAALTLGTKVASLTVVFNALGLLSEILTSKRLPEPADLTAGKRLNQNTI